MPERNDKYVQSVRRMSDAELLVILESIMDDDNMTPLEKAALDELDRRDF